MQIAHFFFHFYTNMQIYIFTPIANASYIISQKNNPKLKLQSSNKENAAVKFGHHVHFQTLVQRLNLSVNLLLMYLFACKFQSSNFYKDLHPCA